MLSNMQHLLGACVHTNAFSGLFFECVVDPSGLASGGSILKPKTDLERGKVKPFPGSSWNCT